MLFAGIVSNANAVPIKIEFTGTVFSSERFDIDGVRTPEPTLLGLNVTGGFLIETEGLQRVSVSNSLFNALSFNDAPAAPEWVTSWLTIGETAIDVGLYELESGGIRYQDSRGTSGCAPVCPPTAAPDQLGFLDGSAQVIVDPSASPPPGTYFGRQLTLSSTALPDPANPAAVTQYFDLSAHFDALTSLDLPMFISGNRVGGGYIERTTTCVPLSCRSFSSLAVAFNVTTVTRQIVSVPEPATLPLAAAALLMLGAVRRRRASRE